MTKLSILLCVSLVLFYTNRIYSCPSHTPPAPPPPPRPTPPPTLPPWTYNVTVNDIRLKYSMGPDLDHTRIKRSNYLPLHSYVQESTTCEGIRPGLVNLARGVNPHFFDLNETTPIYRTLFNFNCNSSRIDDKGYLTPLEVEPIFSRPSRLQDEGIKYFPTLDSIIVDTNREDVRTYIRKVTSSYSNHYINLRNGETRSDTASILSSTRSELYTAIIHSALKPLGSLERDFNSLPGNYNEGLQAWLDFLLTSGTHFYINGLIGGRVRVHFFVAGQAIADSERRDIPIEDGNQTIRALIDGITERYNGNINGRVILLEGGAMGYDQTIDQWVLTVEQQPIILQGRKSSIMYLLDPLRTEPVKWSSFVVMEKALANFYSLSRNMLGGYFWQSEPLISTAILEAIRQEQEYILIDSDFVATVSNLVKNHRDLARDYAICRRTVEIPNMRMIEQEHTKYIMLPGVCASRKETGLRFPTCQLQSRLSNLFPTNNCVLLYNDNHCEGTPDKKTLTDAFESIHEYTSFMVCPPHIQVE